MNNILISYRREDSGGGARGLFQSLVNAFGANRVFMDVEAIGLGTDFAEVFDKSLASCGVLLVLIGRRWLDSTDAAGHRRLDDPQDFVRMEVVKALEQNIRVIPVLVKGAGMPEAEALPEALRPLTRHQALELCNESWDQDVEHLTSVLADLLGIERRGRNTINPIPPGAHKKIGRRIAVGLAAVMAAAILVVTGNVWISGNQSAPIILQPAISNPANQDPNASPAPASIDRSTAQAPAAAPKPEPPTPAKPNTPKAINLGGLWVDAEGVNVQISHQSSRVVSQAYNPLTGLSINAIWQVSGRRVAFNWASNTGNQGVGDGTIAGDGNTIDYRYVDHVTGEQGYSILFRVVE